jgi:sialic acid synthase SpsE
LIDAACEAQANVVKFQTFKADQIISKTAPKAEYQITNTGDNESQLEMVKKLELDCNAHCELMSYCQEKNI